MRYASTNSVFTKREMMIAPANDLAFSHSQRPKVDDDLFLPPAARALATTLPPLGGGVFCGRFAMGGCGVRANG
jgi:hypothetical protein